MQLFSRNIPTFYGLIWAVLIHILGAAILTLTGNTIIAAAICVYSLLLYFYYIVSSDVGWRFLPRSISLPFCLFLFWQIIIVLRGLFGGGVEMSFNGYFSYYAVNYLFILPILIPFVSLIRFDFRLFSYFKKMAIPLCVVFFLLVLIFFKELLLANYSLESSLIDSTSGYKGEQLGIRSLVAILVSIAPIFLFSSKCFMYLPSKINKCVLVAVFLTLLLALRAAGRGYIIEILMHLFILGYLYLANNRGSNLFIRFWTIFLISFAIIAFYFMNASSLFLYITERGLDDSRSLVETGFIKDFNRDVWDWILGRGLYGTYRTSVNLKGFDNRLWMETGYLYLILKGGIINLGLYVWVLFSTFVRGFFKSQNLLCKGAALFVLLQIIMLYPFGLPAFSLNYLLLWFFIGLLNKSRFRNLSDLQIKKLFT